MKRSEKFWLLMYFIFLVAFDVFVYFYAVKWGKHSVSTDFAVFWTAILLNGAIIVAYLPKQISKFNAWLDKEK